MCEEQRLFITVITIVRLLIDMPAAAAAAAYR
jgi:hypothetical protein